MDNRSESERYQEWIKHPVTQDLARRIQKISDDCLTKYDNATPEEVRRLQLIRRLILVDLPQMVEKSINPPQRKERWDWRRFLGL